MAQPTAYQRVTTSTDYDASAGVMALVFDGVDDSMYSAASINFNGLPADGQTKRNLLSASEAFDDAWWFKNVSTITANATTAPDGTTTADKLVETAAAGLHAVLPNVFPTITSGATYTLSVYAKAAERTAVCIRDNGSANTGGFFDLSSGVVRSSEASATTAIESVGNGWYRCSVRYTATSTSANVQAQLVSTGTTASYSGDGTSGIHIWGAQLEAGSTATAYQKTGTDKMTVFAGVHKASDAARGMVVETNTANGAFQLSAPSPALVGFMFGSVGTILQTAASTDAAPASRVVTGVADIAGDKTKLRLNGVQVAETVADQGTGNFGNYPLYIGRRNNASLPFNGRLYQLALKGKSMSAAEITTVESFVNSKTKAY